MYPVDGRRLRMTWPEAARLPQRVRPAARPTCKRRQGDSAHSLPRPWRPGHANMQVQSCHGLEPPGYPNKVRPAARPTCKRRQGDSAHSLPRAMEARPCRLTAPPRNDGTRGPPAPAEDARWGSICPSRHDRRRQRTARRTTQERFLRLQPLECLCRRAPETPPGCRHSWRRPSSNAGRGQSPTGPTSAEAAGLPVTGGAPPTLPRRGSPNRETRGKAPPSVCSANVLARKEQWWSGSRYPTLGTQVPPRSPGSPLPG